MIRNKIRLLAKSEVPYGTTGRFVCLNCNGGQSKEKSLAITRDSGKILYKCHRDSCNLPPGIIFEYDGIEPIVPVKDKRREYTKDLVNLTEQDYEFFWDKFRLEEEDLQGVRRCLETRRYLLPIIGHGGQLRGHIARSFDGLVPKASAYKYKCDEPFIGWIHPIRNWIDESSVVIVEDWFSAAKVAKAGISAITINGTHISWEAALEAVLDYDEVILALDRGTLPKMLKYCNIYGSLWPKYRVWSLDKDLKYEQEEKIRNAASNREATTFRCPEGQEGV